MKSAWKLYAILFLATTLVAQTSTSPKSRKAKPAPVTAADVPGVKRRACRAAVSPGFSAAANPGLAGRTAAQGPGGATGADGSHRCFG